MEIKRKTPKKGGIAVKKWIAGFIVVLMVVAVFIENAVADYKHGDYTVHWAGGNKIVVTDKNGNKVYEGEGIRSSDGKRLMWDGTSNVDSSGNKTSKTKKVTESVKESDFSKPGYEDRTYGIGGATRSSSSSSNSKSSSSSSPYEGTQYSNMQPIIIRTADGRTLSGYANVYAQRDSSGNTLGYSAVPVTSAIGKELAKAGFQVKDGMVLIHYGSSNAEVKWESAGVTGPSEYNVSTTYKSPSATGGGVITVTIKGSGESSRDSRDSRDSSYNGDTSPGTSGTTYIYDTRCLQAYADTSVIKAGGKLNVTAIVSGTTDKVEVKLPWGGTINLTKKDSSTFTGSIDVPQDTSSGEYNFIFSSDISQPPYYPAQTFTATIKVRVVEKDVRSLEGAPDTPIVKVGKALPLTAKVQGTTSQVNVYTTWGGTGVLTKQPDGLYKGFIMVPVNTAPGIYQITFEARISQPPDYPEALYTAQSTVRVAALDEPMTDEGTQSEEDEYNWWTPPWIQGR
ncbi:hypothetical protein AN618_23510 [Fervidicola ferrireducens]|uniref:Uncharacterized protein n=2 Tax=Fervidicola ferrireducens TaxID=520764 RepID=A0A140L180_9FIRM|nr:hypothetical protein AN618_23510 [Fervidicola ferrireducens]